MPTVKAIEWTGMPSSQVAARLLAFTKNTRLSMSPEGFDEWMDRPWEDIDNELTYMVATLPSSWEFVSVTFFIGEVSRACAQQITRTRTASYAMQAQRVVDVRDAGYHVPESLNEEGQERFREMANQSIANYAAMLDEGMKPEDARELLPIGMHSNIVVRHNLRSLVDLVSKRKSLRVQSEYRGIISQMEAETKRIWPWSGRFFLDRHERALRMLEAIAETNPSLRIDIAKAVDLIRTNR